MQPDRLNLRHLRAVMAIVEGGTVIAAARAVSLTQPAITQAVAKLEQQLGTKLFYRSPAGMVATEAGRLLATRSARALQLIASSRVTAPQARSLTALARHGSYAAAAAALRVREPSVHRAVTELSVSLSQKIVERRGRRVVLTARGAALARRFSLAEAELNSAIAELQRLHGQEVGRIALGAMPLSRAKLLPDTISKFHRLHPTVNVAVVEGSHAELLGPLMNGEIDIMIGALRSSVAPDLTQRPLFVDRPVILARSGHPLVSHGASTTTEQLAQFPWVVPALETPLRTQWAQMFETSGIRPPPVAIECGSVLVIRQLLMENDFLTLLSPTQVAVELEAGWLATVCAAPGDPARTIGVTVRTDWCPTHFQRSFLDLIDAQAKTLQSHNT